MADKAFSPFEMAQRRFDDAANTLGLDDGTRDLLRYPLREYSIAIPARMDDGSVKVFRGFRGTAQRRQGAVQGG